jgi:hypothetical protein
MRKLLLFLALLMPTGLTWAQEQAIVPPPVFQPAPPIRFTVQDVISVIADYNVKQLDYPAAIAQVYGLTDHQYTFTIYLFKDDTATKRSTLIHEILHVLYNQHGLLVPEEQINADERVIYQQLFVGQ